jgi:hypothetical protein
MAQLERYHSDDAASRYGQLYQTICCELCDEITGTEDNPLYECGTCNRMYHMKCMHLNSPLTENEELKCECCRYGTDAHHTRQLVVAEWEAERVGEKLTVALAVRVAVAQGVGVGSGVGDSSGLGVSPGVLLSVASAVASARTPAAVASSPAAARVAAVEAAAEAECGAQARSYRLRRGKLCCWPRVGSTRLSASDRICPRGAWTGRRIDELAGDEANHMRP